MAGTKRSLQDFLGDGVSKDKIETGQLAKVLTLHPKYFPEELYTSYEERWVSFFVIPFFLLTLFLRSLLYF